MVAPVSPQEQGDLKNGQDKLCDRPISSGYEQPLRHSSSETARKGVEHLPMKDFHTAKAQPPTIGTICSVRSMSSTCTERTYAFIDDDLVSMVDKLNSGHVPTLNTLPSTPPAHLSFTNGFQPPTSRTRQGRSYKCCACAVLSLVLGLALGGLAVWLALYFTQPHSTTTSYPGTETSTPSINTRVTGYSPTASSTPNLLTRTSTSDSTSTTKTTRQRDTTTTHFTVTSSSTRIRTEPSSSPPPLPPPSATSSPSPSPSSATSLSSSALPTLETSDTTRSPRLTRTPTENTTAITTTKQRKTNSTTTSTQQQQVMALLNPRKCQ